MYNDGSFGFACDQREHKCKVILHLTRDSMGYFNGEAHNHGPRPAEILEVFCIKLYKQKSNIRLIKSVNWIRRRKTQKSK